MHSPVPYGHNVTYNLSSWHHHVTSQLRSAVMVAVHVNQTCSKATVPISA